MQILVVDDNIMDRKYIKYLLENNLHISPKTAKDGKDALNKLQENNFDLVITDIVMPNMDGIELVCRLKSDFPDMRIIAMTGNNPYYLQIVNKLGVDAVYAKPFDAPLLVEHVENIIKHLSNSACA